MTSPLDIAVFAQAIQAPRSRLGLAFHVHDRRVSILERTLRTAPVRGGDTLAQSYRDRGERLGQGGSEGPTIGNGAVFGAVADTAVVDAFVNALAKHRHVDCETEPPLVQPATMSGAAAHCLGNSTDGGDGHGRCSNTT